MINKSSCYKNPEKPSCINLILTNCLSSFQHSCIMETGLSDFYKIVTTIMKTTFRKIEPKVIKYRGYKYFAMILLGSLYKILFTEFAKFKTLQKLCKNVLDKIAPWKKKYVRGTHSPFMNKALTKAIMVRTKLRNTFLKNRSE